MQYNYLLFLVIKKNEKGLTNIWHNKNKKRFPVFTDMFF